MANDNRKSKGFLARLLRDRSGNTLAMAGAALIPIAGMIGSGLDMARAYMAEAKLQNACDAGALAARRTMEGATFDGDVEAEGERFFDFNFPADTMNAQNVQRTVAQDTDDETTVVVDASADIPTTVMRLFGKQTIPITVTCNADNDYGNNDIMLVLDVTGSMNCPPGYSGGCSYEHSDSKASILRTAASSLYNTLANAANTRTRYGIMPYSVTVNVGRDLRNVDIRTQSRVYRCLGTDFYYGTEYCSDGKGVTNYHINETSWGTKGAWRTNGYACVEERPDSGNAATPIQVSTTIDQADIDAVAETNADKALQWGRYDRGAIVDDNPWYSLDPLNPSYACPEEASQLREYSSLSSFNSAISDATAQLNGSTYHDVGMIWGARYLSSTGMFASDNPTSWNNIPVAKHIIFLTDGIISTNDNTYTTYGVENIYDRVSGSGTTSQQHIARFLSACTRAKAMGMTVWVIALDTGYTADIASCATSSDHFYTSDGTDLADVFATIGQGIGRLRLTQ